MKLVEVEIKNYRLIEDAVINFDPNLTLIVGRNNTAKTSFLECLFRFINGRGFSFADYPLQKRHEVYELLDHLRTGIISYEEFCEQFPIISASFRIDYSDDGDSVALGTLSPFIIDLDPENSEALIRAEYRLCISEIKLKEIFDEVSDFGEEGKVLTRSMFKSYFDSFFRSVIYAVNPKKLEDRKLIDADCLQNLFPCWLIPAERTLGEDEKQRNSLESLIDNFFDAEHGNLKLDEGLQKELKELRQEIARASKVVQEKSERALSQLVDKTVNFGYPNHNELSLFVSTELKLDDQIKKQSTLSYVSENSRESLPSSRNGLGYKNLLKIEFILSSLARELRRNDQNCLPLLFIEEPESHMHPQMQERFAEYVQDFINEIGNRNIQVVLTSHSPHIANSTDFSRIRYAKRSSQGVIYKDLGSFAQNEQNNIDFIRKYLTLSKSDLFFADKAILVEGDSERILLPDIINTFYGSSNSASEENHLQNQYYTIATVGGAHAHLFMPFMNFLGLPCLILTDLDPVRENSESRKKNKCMVSEGETTSNATIKWWMKQRRRLTRKTTPSIEDILNLTADEKTINHCHIEFQTTENGFCGRSLEEAIKNVNRGIYGIEEEFNESKLAFNGKSKIEFALNLILKEKSDDSPVYEVPAYIRQGLNWLSSQDLYER